MLARNYCSFFGRFQQARLFFSRHVYEPRLIARNPQGPDKKSLPVDPLKPVVLLIGWAGAEHEQLEKFSDIYTEQGYRTVSFIAPCYHYTTPNARNGFYLSPVFRGIDAKTGNFESFKHSPLICHIFSMNGVRCLISLWKWTEAERMTHLRQRIKGLIFDSAPARTRAGPDSLAVVLSTPPMEGLSWVSTETRRKMIMLGFNLRKAMANSISAMVPSLRPHLSMFYYLKECADLPNSQLFLYSKEDKLVQYQYVKKFLEYQKSMGRDVVDVMFANSDHVQHYRTHPEQYRSTCIEFLKKIEKSLEHSH